MFNIIVLAETPCLVLYLVSNSHFIVKIVQIFILAFLAVNVAEILFSTRRRVSFPFNPRCEEKSHGGVKVKNGKENFSQIILTGLGVHINL